MMMILLAVPTSATEDLDAYFCPVTMIGSTPSCSECSEMYSGKWAYLYNPTTGECDRISSCRRIGAPWTADQLSSRPWRSGTRYQEDWLAWNMEDRPEDQRDLVGLALFCLSPHEAVNVYQILPAGEDSVHAAIIDGTSGFIGLAEINTTEHFDKNSADTIYTAGKGKYGCVLETRGIVGLNGIGSRLEDANRIRKWSKTATFALCSSILDHVHSDVSKTANTQGYYHVTGLDEVSLVPLHKIYAVCDHSREIQGFSRIADQPRQSPTVEVNCQLDPELRSIMSGDYVFKTSVREIGPCILNTTVRSECRIASGFPPLEEFKFSDEQLSNRAQSKISTRFSYREITESRVVSTRGYVDLICLDYPSSLTEPVDVDVNLILPEQESELAWSIESTEKTGFRRAAVIDIDSIRCHADANEYTVVTSIVDGAHSTNPSRCPPTEHVTATLMHQGSPVSSYGFERSKVSALDAIQWEALQMDAPSEQIPEDDADRVFLSRDVYITAVDSTSFNKSARVTVRDLQLSKQYMKTAPSGDSNSCNSLEFTTYTFYLDSECGSTTNQLSVTDSGKPIELKSSTWTPIMTKAFPDDLVIRNWDFDLAASNTSNLAPQIVRHLQTVGNELGIVSENPFNREYIPAQLAFDVLVTDDDRTTRECKDYFEVEASITVNAHAICGGSATFNFVSKVHFIGTGLEQSTPDQYVTRVEFCASVSKDHKGITVSSSLLGLVALDIGQIKLRNLRDGLYGSLNSLAKFDSKSWPVQADWFPSNSKEGNVLSFSGIDVCGNVTPFTTKLYVMDSETGSAMCTPRILNGISGSNTVVIPLVPTKSTLTELQIAASRPRKSHRGSSRAKSANRDDYLLYSVDERTFSGVTELLKLNVDRKLSESVSLAHNDNGASAINPALTKHSGSSSMYYDGINLVIVCVLSAYLMFGAR